MRILSLTSVVGLLLVGAACEQDYALSGERPSVDPADVTECGFNPVAGTKFSEYACNPVFGGSGEGWAANIGSVGFLASDVLGHPFYQMWYVGQPSSGAQSQAKIGYAVSGDGTGWEDHPANPILSQDPAAWDKDSVSSQVVLWDVVTGQYVMSYQGVTFGVDQFDPGIWGMGVATSFDGVEWVKHPSNPVIDFGELRGLGGPSPCWPLSINTAPMGYRGFIGASDPDPFGGLFGGQPTCHVYPITSSDLSSWTMGNAPVIRADLPHEMGGIGSLQVVELNGVQYMFYTAFADWNVVEGQNYVTAKDHTLNIATSIDGGLTWIKDPSNPQPLDKNASKKLSGVSAQVVGERIHLWLTDEYSAGQSAIGYFYYEPNIELHP